MGHFRKESIALFPMTSSPRHVFVFLEIFSREGGIQSYVKDIFQAYTALPTANGTVFLLRDEMTEQPFASDRLRFHYLKTPLAALGRARLTMTLLTYLIRHQPEHVYCGHIHLAPLIQIICKPLGIPYTVLTYGKEVWQMLPIQKRQALQNADRIWTISRYSRDQACESNGIDSTKFDMLPCVVDGNVFTPGLASSELIEKYQLSHAKVLMTVARLWSGDPYKGVDVTIRALPEIAQAFPDIKYLVIGRGDDQPRLAQLAADLGVSDRVIFAGFVATEDLVAHYRLADAYVMPSQEGFGIVYLEAMACGIPVLAGDADGSADPLQDGQLGWPVPHRDPAAVATAVITMLKGDDQRCDGIWLRQQVLARFGKAALADHLQQLLGSRHSIKN
jgi:phosphatidyl-myo-inositol dimannoside synthase